MLLHPLKKKRIGDKSKKLIKPTSLGREQNKSRTKLKQQKVDQNQFKRFTNKALLSLSMEMEDKKYNYKSTLEQEPKAKKVSPIKKKPKTNNHLSSVILKSDLIKKRDSHSALEGKKTSKQRMTKSKKPRMTIQQKNRALSKLSVYPGISDQLMLGFSSSQIFFSSYGQSRDQMKSKVPSKSKKSSIDQMSFGSHLQIDAKYQLFRKEKAVTKIQKIWRGYQTRKILDLFLNNEIPRLQQKRDQFISNRHQTLEINDNSSYNHQFYGTFVDVSLNLNNNNENDISSDISVSERHQDFSSVEISHVDQIPGFEPKSHPQNNKIQDNPDNEQDEDYYNDEDSDQQITQFPGYHRSRPIHSHEQLHQQMRGMSQQQQDQYCQQSDQQNQYGYYRQQQYTHPEVIIETNQEYIQSRKNSMQNRNKKPFDSSFRRISTQGFNPANTISQQPREQDKDDKIDIHSGKIYQTIEVNSNQQNFEIKFRQLQEQQKWKWESIIQFIRIQRKNGNSANNILDDILQIVQNNKNDLIQIVNHKQKQIQKIHRIDTYIMTTQQSKNKQQTQKSQQKPMQSHSSHKRNLKLDIDERNSYTNNEPLASKSKISDFEITRKFQQLMCAGFDDSRQQQIIKMKQLKKQLLKNQGFNSSVVEQIIILREKILKDWEKSEYEKIYEEYKNKILSQEQFQTKLVNLNRLAQEQRQQIERNKKQIEKGLKVASKVFQKVERHLISKRMGFSKSAQSLNHVKLNSFILLNKFGEEKYTPVFVDQAGPVSNPRPARNFFVNQIDSDELDFTQQQYRSFTRPNLSPNQFTQLNRNIIITQQFLRGQHVVQTQSQQSDNSSLLDPRIDDYVNEVSKGIQTLIINQVAIQFYKNSNVFENISSKFNIQFLKPKKVSKSQLNQFITEIYLNLPKDEILKERLNQQICPPPFQLLKCMRVDLFPIDYDEDENMDDIGKYQFIIPQNICIQAIQKLLLQRIMSHSSPRLDLINTLQYVDTQLNQHLDNRQKFLKLKQQQLTEKNKQIFQAQMHCVFDCWNQQIIISKSQLPGFSGIGLNQATLSLVDQNILVQQKQVHQYINLAKDKLLKIINQDSQLNISKRIQKMSFQQICQNQGSWVCYTDQALGFLLQLDFVIFEEMMVQMARILQKRSLINN